MSSQIPPDPITTVFNPEAWEEPTGLLSKLRALVHYYVTYPIAQNYPITFSNLVFVTDATLTKMANTSYVIANLVSYLASLPPLLTSTTWSAIQNFTGIETNTVNPIGATLTIGNTAVNTNIEIATRNGRTAVLHLGDGPNSTGDIHIGNGLGSTNPIQLLYAGDNGSSGVLNLGSATSTTNLYSPLTPIHTYPITPFIPTSGTFNYGTGKIGHMIVASQNNGNLTASGINPPSANDYRVAGYFTGTTISVPPGVWILQLEFVSTVIYGVSIGLSFGTTPIPAGVPNAITTKKAGMFGCQYNGRNNSGISNQIILSYNQTTCHYTNTTGSNVNIYGFLYVGGYGYGGQRATMTAVRIA